MTLRLSIGLLLALTIALGASGCGDDESETRMITLSEVIPDPVQVGLGQNTASMVFDFSARPLDVDQAEDLRYVLFSGGIGLTVTNTATGISYNLTSGTGVTGTPAAAGQYAVTASEDGHEVTVTFFNSSFDGKSIHGAGTYSAAVTVLENGHFTVETFARSVAITE